MYINVYAVIKILPWKYRNIIGVPFHVHMMLKINIKNNLDYKNAVLTKNTIDIFQYC